MAVALPAAGHASHEHCLICHQASIQEVCLIVVVFVVANCVECTSLVVDL